MFCRQTFEVCQTSNFFDVHCTTTTWNLLTRRFTEDVNIRRGIFFFFNWIKANKNSKLGEIAYIWKIERVQVDTIRLKGHKFIFLARFSLLSSSSSSLLKLLNGEARTVKLFLSLSKGHWIVVDLNEGRNRMVDQEFTGRLIIHHPHWLQWSYMYSR